MRADKPPFFEKPCGLEDRTSHNNTSGIIHFCAKHSQKPNLAWELFSGMFESAISKYITYLEIGASNRWRGRKSKCTPGWYVPAHRLTRYQPCVSIRFGKRPPFQADKRKYACAEKGGWGKKAESVCGRELWAEGLDVQYVGCCGEETKGFFPRCEHSHRAA